MDRLVELARCRQSGGYCKYEQYRGAPWMKSGFHWRRSRDAAPPPGLRIVSSATAAQMFDDGWDTLEEGLAQPREPLRTEVIWEDARSIISGNDSPDVYFDRSINPYRGCEHGCIYCYARPTHSYLNMSPGLDFETKIIAKRNIARGAARGNGQEELRAAAHRHRHGHRLLPAGGARTAPDAIGDRADARDAPRVFAGHQVERRGARPGPDRADGGDGAGERVRHDHHAGCGSDAQARAARGGAAPAAADPAHPGRAWRALRGQPGAADSLPHRRHGAGAGSRLGRGRAQRLLSRVAAALGGEPAVQAVAGGALSAARRKESWRASTTCAAARTTTATSPRA